MAAHPRTFRERGELLIAIPPLLGRDYAMQLHEETLLHATLRGLVGLAN
jgi:hypothetical protein